MAAVGDRIYLFGGTPEWPAGRAVWEFSPDTGSLRQLPCSFYSPLISAAASTFEGKAYVFGGVLGGMRSAAIWAFDPRTETLVQVGSLPVPALAMAAVPLGDQIYLFGGDSEEGWQDRILAFSPVTRRVVDTGYRLPVGAARIGAAALDGAVYLLGGISGDRGQPSELDTLWVFRPGEGVRRLSPALAVVPPRWGAVAAAWHGEVHFCGGTGRASRELSQVLRLGWWAGRAGPVTDLGVDLRGMCAAAGPQGEIYVLGGWWPGTPAGVVRRVRPEEGRVEVLGLRLPRAVMNAACARVGNRIFVIGGRPLSGYLGARVDEIVAVAIDTGVVTRVGRLPRGLEGTAAATWGDLVYLFGGLGDGGLSDRVYRFDPASGSVEELPARLPSGREQVAAAAGPEGIWLVGGRGEAGCLDEVLLFDPRQGTLRLVARLPTPLAGAAAVAEGECIYLIGGATPAGPSDGVLQLGEGGTVRDTGYRLPAGATGVAVALGGQAYLVEDGGLILRVEPRPRIRWHLEAPHPADWRVGGIQGTGVELGFRASSDGLSWSERADDPASLPPARYLEVEAAFSPQSSARLESIRLVPHR